MAVNFSLGFRYGLDLVLLWLWHRPASTALIQLLAWELPYATGVAPKKKKKNRNPRQNSRLTESVTGQEAREYALTTSPSGDGHAH